MITTEEFNGVLRLNFNGKAYIGYAYRDIDGYFVFVNVGDGTWNEYSLRLVADKLQELNKDWNEQIKNYEKKKI